MLTREMVWSRNTCTVYLIYIFRVWQAVATNHGRPNSLVSHNLANHHVKVLKSCMLVLLGRFSLYLSHFLNIYSNFESSRHCPLYRS